MRIELGGNRYNQFSYPANELQVRLTQTTIKELEADPSKVVIIARNLDSDYLVELALLRDAIVGVNSNVPIYAVLPYLPYSRADRRFVEGDCHGLATFGRLLFNMGLSSIVTLDVHSDKAHNFIADLTNITPEPFITDAVNRFAKEQGVHAVNVLFPDEGAALRYKLPKIYGCNTYDIEAFFGNCWKNRAPETGKLSGFEVPDLGELEDAPILIVDDICDGGGTFVGIAQALRAKGVPERNALGLYVTHGIFSKGMRTLNEHFKSIYTTDSFTHLYNGQLARMECVDYLVKHGTI